MMDKGGLAKEIADRRAGWMIRKPSHVERRVLGVLEASTTATGEWRKLVELGSGRWVNTPAPAMADMLDMIVRSAVLAAEREKVRTLRKTTEAEYKALVGAAVPLFEHYAAQAGVDAETFDQLALQDKNTFALASANKMDGILEDLVILQAYDLVDIDSLPRPAVREGSGAQVRAEARTFEFYLATFIERTYGRPCQAFVVWLSGQLYPDAPEGDEDTLAPYRMWERDDRRVKAEATAQQDREKEAHWERVAAMPEPVEDPFFGLSEGPVSKGPSAAERKRWLRRAWRMPRFSDLED